MNDVPRLISIGLIGAGGNMRLRHIPGLHREPGVRLAVVANRTVESSAAAAREFGIPRWAEDWREIVNDPAIDAIVIGTWPSMHAPITIAALEAGKHVLCEARMAMNLDEARQMLTAAEEHPELVAQLVPAPMTLWADEKIVTLLHDGTLGELYHLELRASTGYVNPEAPLHWRHAREHSGLNIMSLGIWYEAMLRWVGPARDVFARGRVVVPERRDSTGAVQAVFIPDHLDVSFTLERGAQGRMLITNVCGGLPPYEVWLHGSRATLRLDAGGLFLHRPGQAGVERVAQPDPNDDGWRVEHDFIESIRHGTPVRLTDFATGVRYMAFTQAVHESLTEGDARQVA